MISKSIFRILLIVWDSFIHSFGLGYQTVQSFVLNLFFYVGTFG